MESNKNAFTLIELLITMIILASLALLLIGNFMSSLTKGRDSKRKGDLNQLRQAIEMFYEDRRSYPYEKGTASNNLIDTSNYVNSNNSFIVSNKTYINRLPQDPNSSFKYVYVTDDNVGSYYRLFSCIENSNDTSEGVSQTGFTGGPANCGSGCPICKYSISSPNITPLPTVP